MQEIIYVRPGARNAFRYWGAHYFVEFDLYWVISYNSSLATHMGLCKSTCYLKIFGLLVMQQP
ncbi:hypothetical protein KC19_6G095500 [Ceratodon purpureus]|uniref:Uncharacterized protein n=1 Tax=Ceratodon purpureus TaxID=3225 RepID=A0A8T0HGQ0_CERPU|nr:hypothetical protein KC19_6G095500 [Ceratodon purpureus]